MFKHAMYIYDNMEFIVLITGSVPDIDRAQEITFWRNAGSINDS